MQEGEYHKCEIDYDALDTTNTTIETLAQQESEEEEITLENMGDYDMTEKCEEGQYFDLDIGKCTNCSSHCLECHNNFNCIECEESYYFNIDRCVKEGEENANGHVMNEMTIQSNLDIPNCRIPFGITCSICEDRFYKTTDLQCGACLSFCMDCEDTVSCNQCDNGRPSHLISWKIKKYNRFCCHFQVGTN